MAPRNDKPTDTPQWIKTGIEPTVPKQTAGWAQDEKPPFDFFNWFWNKVSLSLNYMFGRAAKYNIIIDSDVEEGDYDTLEAYIADAPAAGDRLLVRQTQSLTGVMVLPGGIAIDFLEGAEIVSDGVAATILTLGVGTSINTPMTLRIDTNGAIPVGVLFDGDNAHAERINIIHEGNGALAAAFAISIGAEYVDATGTVDITGAGSVTAVMSDLSVTISNIVQVAHIGGVAKVAGFAHTHDSVDEGGDLGIFASGTAMVFYQAAAPIGWTKDVTNNDKALRIVSGGSGGTAAAPGLDPLSTPPTHTHEAAAHDHRTPFGNAGGNFLIDLTAPYGTSGPNLTASHIVSISGNATSFTPLTTSEVSAATTGNASDVFAPDYIDVIICTKD